MTIFCLLCHTAGSLLKQVGLYTDADCVCVFLGELNPILLKIRRENSYFSGLPTI